MDIITIVIVLIIVGAVLYIVNKVIPMDQMIRTIINVLVIVVVAIWILKSLAGVADLRI